MAKSRIDVLYPNKRTENFLRPSNLHDNFKNVHTWFIHIYLSSIAKEVLATYIYPFRVRFLEPASAGVI
jgi:hypothetical protein